MENEKAKTPEMEVKAAEIPATETPATETPAPEPENPSVEEGQVIDVDNMTTPIAATFTIAVNYNAPISNVLGIMNDCIRSFASEVQKIKNLEELDDVSFTVKVNALQQGTITVHQISVSKKLNQDGGPIYTANQIS